jgi:hypothetical protein
MTNSPPRSVRGIDADFRRACARVERASVAGGVAALVVLIFAGWYERVEHARLEAEALLVCAIVLAVAAYKTRALSRTAAVILVTVYVATGVAITWRSAIPLTIGPQFAFWLLVVAGALDVFRLPRLLREFDSVYVPRPLAAGDICTVRDGAHFTVVKILAVEDARVHVRQFALRYPERPWQVKTSLLERDVAVNGGQRFPHLPLDANEFLRWEPVFLRNEPLMSDELIPLQRWIAVQGSATTLSTTTS